MKRIGGLFDRLASFENLCAAFVEARRGKRKTDEMAAFELAAEANVIEIREHLLASTYRFGPYRSFRICDPKPRTIVAAPFRDRVVHHATCRVLEPVLDRTFIGDSFACRAGKGNLAAVLRLRDFVRAVPDGWALSCDVRRYFQSVR
ncbi:MAG: RNA-dependent DNA polymerase, partial [Myxococcota bacterium]|nr:RNA-dependent DNA polymerase [Myxococcota bacterium]